MLYACNVKEDELSNSSENPHVINLQSWTSEQQDASSCIISAKMEEELSELSDEDISEYLEAIEVSDSGVSNLIQSTYDLLGLASFIKAEVVSYDELISAGSLQSAREAGKVRLEGKDYLFKNGDVTLFKCNA